MGARGFALVCLAVCAAHAASLDDTLALGRKALANEGVATAWRLAQTAIHEAPESAPAHELAGEVLFRRGDLDQAENEFKQATKLDPKLGLAWWGLARVAECSSRLKSAAEDYERAHQLDPRDFRIFRDWAMRLPIERQTAVLEKYAPALDSKRPEVNDFRQNIQLIQAVRGRPLGVLASPYQPTEIPLDAWTSETNHMRHYVLEVTINDARLKLSLDTGTSGIVIPRRTAAAAGIAHLSDANIGGLGDDFKGSTGYRGIAQRVRIGSVELNGVLISVSNQDSIGAGEGLIGANIFSQFLVTLDFSGRKLRLGQIPGYGSGDADLHDRSIVPETRGFTPVYHFAHLLMVPTRVGDAHGGLFVIDSGADRSLISYDLAAEVSKLSHDDRMHLSGLSGRVADLYDTGDLILQFAGFRQKNLGMTAVDTLEQSRRLGVEISGFLGLPVLELFTLTIDYRDGLVNFARKE